MKRVLVAVAAFPPYASGTGNVAWHHARLLAQGGHEVDVLAPGGQATQTKEGFRVLDAPRGPGLGNAAFFRKLPKLAEYDIVHLHLPFLLGADQLLRARPRPKLLVSYHQDLEARGLVGAAFRAYAPRIGAQLRAADAILVPTLDYARASRHARDLARAIELPNGVDTTFFAPRQRREQASFLFVGGMDRAHHFKGVDVLLRALAKVPDARLTLVGEGELRPGFERLARDLGLGERARFAGRVEAPDLADLYARAAAVVLPSTTRGEIFGLALAEGMASGRPGIASDLPGVRTVVDHEKNGLLVPPGDADALARAMARVLANPEEADAWGQAAREKAVARYDWSRVGEKLLQVVEAA